MSNSKGYKAHKTCIKQTKLFFYIENVQFSQPILHPFPSSPYNPHPLKSGKDAMRGTGETRLLGKASPSI